MAKDWGAKIISSDVDEKTGLGKVAFVIVNQATGQTIPDSGEGVVSGINSIANLQNYFRDQIATITRAEQVKSDLTGLAGTFLDIPDEVKDTPAGPQPPPPPTPLQQFQDAVQLYRRHRRLAEEAFFKAPAGLDLNAELSAINDSISANPEWYNAI